MTKSIRQAGFSLIEALIILIVVAAIALAGWFVYHRNHDDKKSRASQTSAKSSNIQKSSVQPLTTKTYTNSEYGFSFDYPSNWKLTEDLSDAGRGHLEGQVYVTSPNGTIIHFDPNLGGKGGDCFDNEANDYTTRTCSTRNILSFEKTSDIKQAVYFYHVALTDPTSEGGETHYEIGLMSGTSIPLQTGSTLGAYFSTFIMDGTVGDVNNYVQGRDDAANTSSDFFSSQEVEEATPVLQSFKFQ